MAAIANDAPAALKYNKQRAEIGKRLFFDTRLSGDTSISCASCHQPDKAFTDGLPLSKAYTGLDGIRNTPTLINVSLKNKYGIPWFHDGRIGTNLNDVARDQITETAVMNMDMRLMQERVKQDPVYIKMFKRAKWGEPSNGKVRSALEAYMKTLISKNVPNDTNKLSKSAKKGKILFFGKANCGSCHSGVLFSDGKPHNLGVPDNQAVFTEPMRYANFLAFTAFLGVENYRNIKRDPGALILAHNARDFGKFITPTLRELKYTAPYMHNGMLKTLSEVIEFYNNGGGNDPMKTDLLKPLNLTNQEKNDLETFLLSLSGDLLTGKSYEYSGVYSYEAISDWTNVPN